MESIIVLYIFIGIGALVIELMLAGKFESIANEKGYSGFFWWCFFLNIVGYLMVVALPDKKGREETQQQIVSAIERYQTYQSPQSQQQFYSASQSHWNQDLPPL